MNPDQIKLLEEVEQINLEKLNLKGLVDVHNQLNPTNPVKRFKTKDGGVTAIRNVISYQRKALDMNANTAAEVEELEELEAEDQVENGPDEEENEDQVENGPDEEENEDQETPEDGDDEPEDAEDATEEVSGEHPDAPPPETEKKPATRAKREVPDMTVPTAKLEQANNRKELAVWHAHNEGGIVARWDKTAESFMENRDPEKEVPPGKDARDYIERFGTIKGWPKKDELAEAMRDAEVAIQSMNS